MKFKSIACGVAIAVLSATGAQAATPSEEGFFSQVSQWIAGFFSAQSDFVVPKEFPVETPEDPGPGNG